MRRGEGLKISNDKLCRWGDNFTKYDLHDSSSDGIGSSSSALNGLKMRSMFSSLTSLRVGGFHCAIKMNKWEKETNTPCPYIYCMHEYTHDKSLAIDLAEKHKLIIHLIDFLATKLFEIRIIILESSYACIWSSQNCKGHEALVSQDIWPSIKFENLHRSSHYIPNS